MTMDVFFEAKLIVCILYFLMQFAIIHVDADKFECIKYDECSCRIKTTTQYEISLWPMPSHEKTESEFSRNWLFDFNLCHGLNKNTDVQDGGCRNATVCQYLDSNKNETFEVGKFGNVTFGQYDNETKSITLQYYGILQEKEVRSININLTCDVSNASYSLVYLQMFSNNKFKTTIKTKAACLRSVVVPTTPGDVTSSAHDKLKTVYIVLIAVAGLVIVLALGSFVGCKITAKRKRGLLNEEEQHEDYGTVPQVHVQNALSTPVSGPI